MKIGGLDKEWHTKQLLYAVIDNENMRAYFVKRKVILISFIFLGKCQIQQDPIHQSYFSFFYTHKYHRYVTKRGLSEKVVMRLSTNTEIVKVVCSKLAQMTMIIKLF